MGWTYEVMAWMAFDIHLYSNKKEPEYKYIPLYNGNSFIKAIYWLFKLKLKGHKCVKLVWR
jgi:hypothetical protein